MKKFLTYSLAALGTLTLASASQASEPAPGVCFTIEEWKEAGVDKALQPAVVSVDERGWVSMYLLDPSNGKGFLVNIPGDGDRLCIVARVEKMAFLAPKPKS